MIVIPCEQNTPQWLEARRGLPTASSFAEVLAKSRTKGEEASTRRNLRHRLMLERVTGRIFPSFENAATKQGHAREPEARMAYQVATGELVEQVGFCRHDTLETGCSPDGLIGTDGMQEIKSPEPSAHFEALRTRRLPTVYVPQVMGQLWVCGRSWCDFCSWNPDFPERLQLLVIRVERDERYIDRLREEVAVFLDELRADVRALEAMP